MRCLFCALPVSQRLSCLPSDFHALSGMLQTLTVHSDSFASMSSLVHGAFDPLLSAEDESFQTPSVFQRADW